MTTLSFDEFFGAPKEQPATSGLIGQDEYDAERQANIGQIQGQMASYRKQNKANDPRLSVLQKELENETNLLNDQVGKANILQQRNLYDKVAGQVKVGPKTVSVDEFFDNQSGTRPDEPLPEWGVGDNLKQTFGEVGGRVKDLAKGSLQTTGVLSDMILGAPGALWKASVYSGARASGLPADEAEEWSNRLSPAGVLAPVQSTINALGLGEGTEEQAVSKAMDILTQGIKKGAGWLSEKTNGAVPPEDFEEVTNALMGTAGIRGGKAITAKVIANAEKARQLGIEQQSRVQRDLEQTRRTYRTEPTMGEGPLEVNVVGGAEGPLAPEQGVYQNGTRAEHAIPVAGKPHLRMRSQPGQIGEVVPDAPDLSPDLTNKVNQAGGIDPDLLKTMGLGSAVVAAGGWLYMHPEDADKLGVGGLAMAGAIKGKGGMWHPEAVTRLAEPLKDSMTRGRGVEYGNLERGTPEYNAEIEAWKGLWNWADSRIRTYLNKHAGTEGDPLKDVRVPMLGEDVRWEDLTDDLIKSRSAEYYNQRSIDPTIRALEPPPARELVEANRRNPDERVWDFSRGVVEPYRAITSYLSHVGDYLREFVPPEKLQQYDLVRAVKETAEQDAKQAAKMAKARVNQAGTVTFKEYPDGMKWVEVGVPDKEISPSYSIKYHKNADAGFLDEKGGTWKIYKDDKYIGDDLTPDSRESMNENSFRTKEEAEIAAKQLDADFALRNEGDVMGHCVGGYCEMVHSGESKIYSLRDGKGMSHVTIEVGRNDLLSGERLQAAGRPEIWEEYLKSGLRTGRHGDLHSWLKDKYPDVYNQLVGKENIVQIKGKQNRAPVAQYLPYVQDFVKSGKWGEVGDIENAGLVDLNSVKNVRMDNKEKIYETRAREATEFFGDKRFVSRESWQHFERGGRNPDIGQRGSVDPKVLGTVAGAAVGVYLDKDNRLIGAALGGLAGLGLMTGVARRTGPMKAIEKGIKTSVEQFVRKVNPDAMGPRAEQSSAILASHYVEQLQRQIFQGKEGAERQRYFEGKSEKEQVAFVKALETPGVRYKDPKMQGLRDAYKSWMNKIYEQDQANGIKYDPLDNYVYHIFNDPDGVTAFMQQKYGTKWGDPKFTKERSAKLISEVEEAGFTLKYKNPEQIAQARQLASDIAQMKVDALRDLADNGLARKVEKGMKAEPSETTWRSPNGELYFLSDEANQVFHNAFNSKSLWNDAGLLGMTYRGAMWTKNAILPVKLLSLFHPLHIALGMNLGTTAVNTIKGVAAGNKGVIRSIGEIGKSTLLLDIPRQSTFISRKMQPHSMRAFRGDIPADKITELDKQQMQNAYDGGFSPEMAEEYRNQSVKDFRNAISRHSAAAIWHAPFALMEAAWTRPMFQNWIPAVKWEAYQKAASAHLAANPELAGDALARRVALRRVSKMIDDRFGEVQYKTIFMDRLIKDTAVASFLSYGWQLGFVRSYLGAVPESWRAFTQNEGLGAGTLKQKIARGQLDKTLFLGSYLTGTMMYGGLLTYALTDKLPEGILDYIYPRSGDKNKDGTDARVSTPFYTREFIQIPAHVQKGGIVGGMATTVGNKLTPVLGMMKGIIMNKDYFDKAIANPNDDLVTTAQKKGKWLLGELQPMAMNRPKNAPDTGKSKALAAAGFNPAPKYVTHPQSDTEFITVSRRKKKVQ